MLKLFGDDAENTNAGDIFKAVVRSVEGRRVVELFPVCKVCKQAHKDEDRNHQLVSVLKFVRLVN